MNPDVKELKVLDEIREGSDIALKLLDSLQSEATVEHFRLAMRELAGGVTVVTIGKGLDRTGFTSTSVESLSVDPPRVLLTVSEGSSSWKQLQKDPRFGINILRSGHEALANQFAGFGGITGADRYRGARWITLTSGGAAILEDALAGADCVVEEVFSRHGHAIIIGLVKSVLLHADGQPLLYWQGAYRQIANQPSDHP